MVAKTKILGQLGYMSISKTGHQKPVNYTKKLRFSGRPFKTLRTATATDDLRKQQWQHNITLGIDSGRRKSADCST